MIEHLYVHIPFCPKVCPYCSFYKEATDRNKTRAFLDAVLLEAERHSHSLRPRTVFFGGGTPTALSTSQLAYLLEGLHERLDLSAVEEWTFEMNPATVSLEKARCLLEFGVNRFSMGVQAWQTDLLKTLGRVHSAEQAARSYELLREAGCNAINLDLIFGVPGQTIAQWEESLARTVSLGPEHISAYCLTYEEDTPFFDSLQRGEFHANEELDTELFSVTRQILEGEGYEAYEISNFSKPGNRCQHNLAYWWGKDYIGFGPSAFSTNGERRWRNIRDTSAYTSSTLEGTTATDFTESLTPSIRRNERVAFALRTSDGVPINWLHPEEVQKLEAGGLLEICEGRGKLTESGVLLADSVAETLLE